MNESREQLNWSAFRYIANELDAAQASEFESLLLTDQEAREAVADAVAEAARIRLALTGTPAVTPTGTPAVTLPVTAASEQSIWRAQTTRIAVVTAGSCLALLLALCLLRSSQHMSGGAAQQVSESKAFASRAQLAYAWAESRDGLAELQSAASVELADSLDAVLNAPIDPETEPSLVAPSWMLAALEKMDGPVESEIEIQE